MTINSDHFDLSNWKLTLPTDAKGGSSGTAIEIKSLLGFENSNHFFDAEDGAMVFRAPVGGATTSGSKYARSELREMDGTERAAWTLKEGGTMTATLRIDIAPAVGGTPGRIIVGQIHGQDEELVRLYWDNGAIYFRNDQAGSKNEEQRFDLYDSNGTRPNVSLGESFSYKIDAHGDRLLVEVFADGELYTSSTPINAVWQGDTFYFKAGAYLGVNQSQGEGEGQVAFTGLDFSHATGGGLGGWKVDGRPNPPPDGGPIVEPPLPQSGQPGSEAPRPQNPDQEEVPAVGRSLSGTTRAEELVGGAGNDTIRGQAGDDRLNGAGGDDELWGNSGRDALQGGTGDDWLKGGDSSDTYVFGKHHGHDTIVEFRKGEMLVFETGLFRNASEAKAALYLTDDGVALATGDDSSILFTGTSLQQVQAANWILNG